MNANVSQGQFDKTTKLLEQKIKETSDLLIKKIQEESERYIDQLKNTRLSLSDLTMGLRKGIEQSLSDAKAYTDSEIESNAYDDTEIQDIINKFINSYNNFYADTLRFNDVFDTDGQFTGKINPLSVETAALKVGTRSQQLSIQGIEFRVLPYDKPSESDSEEIKAKKAGKLQIINSKNSKSDSVSTNTIAGFMLHYGYGTETEPKVFLIKEQELSLSNNNDSYYIYAELKAIEKVVYNKIELTEKTYNGMFNSLYKKEGNEYVKIIDNEYNKYENASLYIPEGVDTDGSTIYKLLNNSKEEFSNNINSLYKKEGNEYVKIIKTEFNSGTDYYIKETINTVSNTITNTNDIIINNNNNSDYIAKIYVSPEQCTLNNKDGVLTIKLGYISPYLECSDGKKYYRKVDMTYGQTTIDGRLITTGKIEGNGCSIDLDSGEITGKLRFNSDDNDNGSLQSILNDYAKSETITQINQNVNGWIKKAQNIYYFYDKNRSAIDGEYDVNTTFPSHPTIDDSWKPTPEKRVIYIATAERYRFSQESGSNPLPQNVYCGNWYNKLSKTIKTDKVYNVYTDIIDANPQVYTCIESWEEKTVNGTTEYRNPSYSNVEYSDSITTSLSALKGTTTIDGGLLLTSKIITGSDNNTAVLSGVGSYAFYAGASEPNNAKSWIKKNGSAKFGNLLINNSGEISFLNSPLSINPSEYTNSNSNIFDIRNYSFSTDDDSRSYNEYLKNAFENGFTNYIDFTMPITNLVSNYNDYEKASFMFTIYISDISFEQNYEYYFVLNAETYTHSDDDSSVIEGTIEDINIRSNDYIHFYFESHDKSIEPKNFKFEIDISMYKKNFNDGLILYSNGICIAKENTFYAKYINNGDLTEEKKKISFSNKSYTIINVV